MNLAALLQAANERTIAGPATVLDLEAISGVGKTTIYRILDPESDYLLTVTTLIKLASAFDLPVWQFLFPHLDPAQRPRVLTSAEQVEHEKWHVVYLQVQALAHDGRNNPVHPRAPGAGTDDSDSGDNPSGKSPHKRQKYPRH
jgi:hypothetical protein